MKNFSLMTLIRSVRFAAFVFIIMSCIGNKATCLGMHLVSIKEPFVHVKTAMFTGLSEITKSSIFIGEKIKESLCVIDRPLKNASSHIKMSASAIASSFTNVKNIFIKKYNDWNGLYHEETLEGLLQSSRMKKKIAKTKEVFATVNYMLFLGENSLLSYAISTINSVARLSVRIVYFVMGILYSFISQFKFDPNNAWLQAKKSYNTSKKTLLSIEKNGESVLKEMANLPHDMSNYIKKTITQEKTITQDHRSPIINAISEDIKQAENLLKAIGIPNQTLTQALTQAKAQAQALSNKALTQVLIQPLTQSLAQALAIARVQPIATTPAQAASIQALIQVLTHAQAQVQALAPPPGGGRRWWLLWLR